VGRACRLRKLNDTPVLPVILDARLVAVNSNSSHYNDGYRRTEELSSLPWLDGQDYLRIGLGNRIGAASKTRNRDFINKTITNRSLNIKIIIK
jgi:hypothetical protein